VARLAFLLLLLVPAAGANALDGIGGGGDGVLSPARNLIAQRDWPGAVVLLQPIVERDPANADAWNLLGFSERKLKRYDLAEAAYARALALDEDHRGALEYLGELYAETDRRDAAFVLLARLERLCPLGCDELADLRAALEADHRSH
jgi:Flp pilus assembly protein TadD